jgi:outer membrane lipoprotein-sorting protein
MRLAILLFMAVVLAGVASADQDPSNDAQKLYQTMVDKITAAKSLKVVVDMQGTPFGAGKSFEPTFKQTIWIADGNKLRWAFEQPIKGKVDKDGLAVCDGKQLFFQSSAANLNRAAPAGFATKVVDVIAKHGCWVAIAQLNEALDPDGKPFTPLVASNFKLGAKDKVGDKQVQVLTYLVREKGGRPADGGSYTVWIDTKTSLPAKVMLDGANNFRVQETYVDWQLDPKLDARLFDAPK